MLETNSEIELIRIILKRIAGEGIKGVRDLLNSVNWERFKDLIIYHDLTPFTYSVLKDFNSFLPKDLREFLKNNYYCVLVRCQRLWQEFLRISMAFQQMGIMLLPIKGMALLYDIYSYKPIRPMTDLDLLVKEEDLPKAELIFCELGYRKELYGLEEEYWRKNQCHIAFYKKEEEKAPFVELHWSLDFKRENRNILPKLWERIREINVDGKTIKLLSPEDTLFSLALHNRRFGKTLCLKNVYDLILLLNKHASGFGWDYVLNQSRKYGICSTLFFILYQANLLLGLKLPKYVWRELDLPTWKRRIIQRFIEKNTFLSTEEMQNKNLYLKSHFLLYDSFWKPINCVINIPKEQFTKYYGLAIYTERTKFLYQMRLLYMPLKYIWEKVHTDKWD